jgi:hypothetical protein
MTDLTADEILAAIDRALARVSARFAEDNRAGKLKGKEIPVSTRSGAKTRRNQQ